MIVWLFGVVYIGFVLWVSSGCMVACIAAVDIWFSGCASAGGWHGLWLFCIGLDNISFLTVFCLGTG